VSEPLAFRPATDDDAEVLFRWANDPTTREASFDSSPIEWQRHVAWLNQKRSSPGCLLLMAEIGSDAVGVVRFDIDGDATVSVTIAPEHRGQGLAARVIRGGCRELFARTRARAAVAWIKSGNSASLRAFERAGFRQVSDASSDAACYVLAAHDQSDL
jgi:RimJ/RimL family protein N-acetyltransferase